MNEQAIDIKLYKACQTIGMAYESNNGDFEKIVKSILGQLDVKDELIHVQQLRVMKLENEIKVKDEEIGALKQLINDFNNTYNVGDFDFEEWRMKCLKV